MEDEGAFTADRQSFYHSLRHVASQLEVLGQNLPPYEYGKSGAAPKFLCPADLLSKI
jgi:hypothetical protein